MRRRIWRTDDLDYALPPERIAQRPLPERDASRLLVVNRAAGTINDSRFVELANWLDSGDLIVVNDTHVVPALIRARRETGSRIDGLFVREIEPNNWEVLLRGRGRVKVGDRLALEPTELDYAIKLIESLGEGRWTALLEAKDVTTTVLERAGSTPLPPYIRRDEAPDESDRVRYQTVFAKHAGAVAAPTAGLHFSERVFTDLKTRGINRTAVTLHVGPGTFKPINADTLEDHSVEPEWFELGRETAERINQCRDLGGHIVAAGTTSVRVLESCTKIKAGGVESRSGWTELFIQPGHEFAIVDRLLTNFHLPRSSLLALVMAFAGEELIRHAYEHAVAKEYRFYSYGDAMLIL